MLFRSHPKSAKIIIYLQIMLIIARIVAKLLT